MKKLHVPFVSGLCFLLLFQFSAAQSAKPVKSYSVDDIRLNSYDFEGLSEILKKDNDTTYVINFWATWCAPCVAELPHFEAINTESEGQKLQVILVSLDFTKQIEKSVIPFIKRKMKSRVVHLSDPDANSWIAKVDPEWSGAIPATVIYNTSKKMRKFYERSFTLEELKTELKPFVKS